MPVPPWSGLTPADRAIIDKGVEMEIWADPGPIDDFPAVFGASGVIPFQFPPRLISDGKTTNWTEKDYKIWEPVALFMGSTARKIVLEAQYVVTSKSGGWTASFIGDVLRLYKSYFYMPMSQVGDPDNMPLIRLKIYDYANASDIYWRAKSLSITPDGALINDGTTILPLINKISIDLELTTRAAEDPDDALMDMEVLPPKPLKTWY